MDRNHNKKMNKPNKRTNMAAQPQKQLAATARKTEDFRRHQSTQDRKVRELMEENALLKEQLKDSQLKLQMCHCKLAAAQSTIMDLTSKEHSTTTKTRTEMDFSQLTLQLQKAIEDLETCKDKVQTMNNPEQQQHQKVQALKNSIKDLSVKLHQEQAVLLKKALRLDPSTSQKTQTPQAEEVEKVNLQLQKLHTQLLQQAMSLKTPAKEKEGPSKYHWYRSNRDQAQQTDLQQDTRGDKVPLSNSQPEETERAAHDMKVELHKQTAALQEAQLQMDQLKKDLLKTKEEAWKETQKLKASSIPELEHRRKVDAAVAASQNKAEEQLQLHLEQWQEERAALQDSAKKLQKVLVEKQEEWLQKESDMGSRVDDLESRIQEILDKKAKKKQRWLARLFRHSGSK